MDTALVRLTARRRQFRKLYAPPPHMCVTKIKNGSQTSRGNVTRLPSSLRVRNAFRKKERKKKINKKKKKKQKSTQKCARNVAACVDRDLRFLR